MPTTKVIELDDGNFDYEVTQSDQPVLVEFWDESCLPCETLTKTLDELAADRALSAAVGQLLVDNLIFMKRDEIEKTRDLAGEALRDWYIHYL